MGLDLWFRADVERILDAVGAAGDLRGPEYHKALADVARAFGLNRDSAGQPAPRLERGPVDVRWPVGKEVIIYQDNDQ